MLNQKKRSETAKFSCLCSIKSEQISGKCDPCKWGEKAILPNSRHRWCMQGDHCPSSNSFIIVHKSDKLDFNPLSLFFNSAHNNFQLCNRHQIAACLVFPAVMPRLCCCVIKSLVMWYNCPAVTDLQPFRIMMVIYGCLCSGVLCSLWTVLLELRPSCCYLTAHQRDCVLAGQEVASVILTTWQIALYLFFENVGNK